jgi:hypothetical protein
MGGVPDEATRLSEESQLSIRIEEDIDKICIKSFPEDDFADCMDEVKAGFIHIVDITNEFVDFPRNTHMVVTDLDSYSQAIKPMVITNHSLRFRSRFYTLGLHKFSIVDNNDGMYYQGEFIVI